MSASNKSRQRFAILIGSISVIFYLQFDDKRGTGIFCRHINIIFIASGFFHTNFLAIQHHSLRYLNIFRCFHHQMP